MPRILTHIVFQLTLIALLFSCKENQSTSSDTIQEKSASAVSAPFPTLNLMPVPADMRMGDGQFRLDKKFALSINDDAHERLFSASNRFLRRLDGRTGLFFTQGIISKPNPQKTDNPLFLITASREGKIALNEDESYVLTITPEKITLNAPTDIGALHGLETLLQLLSADEKGYYFPAVEINDKPRFAWRGLLIDVSRHYLPMDVLKRNIDAMAAVKMNVMHFHLCDNQGWRVESKTYPKLHQLASDGQYYTHEQIREIVQYAADRGMRVMPEFDVPGHATAMLVAYPELGSAPGPYTLDRDAGIFDPVLNPTIDETYVFLDKLFTEMSSLFPDEYFHIGGDENNGKHWKSNPAIQEFMKKNNMNSVLELQTYFNNRLLKSIQKMNKKMVGWEEILQPGLSKDAIIHSWFGKESLYRAASQGYQTILSNGFYIDLMHPAKDHYSNDPLPPFDEWSDKEKEYKLSPEEEKRILGGEATMWAELVTPLTVDSRIWPRAASIAERLWSPSWVKDVDDMYRRLDVTSIHFEELGLAHIKNRDVILRNLANGRDIAPLKVMVDVIEPYKVYTRNNGGMMYKTYSPFTLMADAASSDARDARIFSQLVEKYSTNQDKEVKKKLYEFLTKWNTNHESFMQLAQTSPVLRQMEKMSEKIKDVSAIGLLVLEKNTLDQDTYLQKTLYIDSLKTDTENKRRSDKIWEDGRTELMILDPVQKLLDLSNPEAANKRMQGNQTGEKKEVVEAVH